MIVITGTGRSGTSVIAKVYDELGFNVAGSDVWWDDANAGYESNVINELNEEMSSRLIRGASGTMGRVGGSLTDALTLLLPRSVKVSVRNLLLKQPGVRNKIWRQAQHGDVLENIASKYDEDMRKISRSYEVVKSPSFMRTLRVWTRSSAAIEGVVLCVRDVDAVVESQREAGFLRFSEYTSAYNNYSYILGIGMAAVLEAEVPYGVVTYPGDLSSSENLDAQLPGLGNDQKECLGQVLSRVVDDKYLN